jgi:hypothetical protein
MENNEQTQKTFQENGVEKQKIIEKAQEERSSELAQILTDEASENLDLVPFVGDGKKIVESFIGRTFSGKELGGKERVIQAAVALGGLVFFFTPPGTVKTARDLTLLAGKSTPAIGDMAEDLKNKGMGRSAAIFEHTEEFMKRYAGTVASAEINLENSLREGFEDLKESITSAFEEDNSEQN